MYRPQFAFRSAPEGFEDQTFSYIWDRTNTPLLANIFSLAVGQELRGVVLETQPDAPFLCRAWKFAGDYPPGYQLGIRIKDPLGNYLDSDYVPIDLETTPSELNPVGAFVVTIEPEIFSQAGAVWQLDFKRLA